MGGGGGGDGVGEWSGVIGLAKMWPSGGLSVWGGESKLEKSWLISQFISSIFSSSSPPVRSVAGRWGSGTVGVIVEVRHPGTSASLSRFLLKLEVIVAKVRDWNS